MLAVLQDDRDDLELLRGALECCVHAMRMPAGAGGGLQGPGGTPPKPPRPEVGGCCSVLA